LNRYLLALVFGGLLVLGGCGRTAEERPVPSQEVAQRALNIALTAWQKGKAPPGKVQDAAPEIHLVETHYRPGQKLTAFKVLGPTTGEMASCYAVILTLDNPREEVRVRYVVLGDDPLWVMRYEDLRH
jgi:hypothetical protein